MNHGKQLTLLLCIVSLAGTFNFSSGQAFAQLTHYVAFDSAGGYFGPGDLHLQGSGDPGFGFNTWFDGAAPGTGSQVVAGNLSLPSQAIGLEVSGDSARTAETDFNLAFYTFDQDEDGANGETGEDNLGAGEHWISFLARADKGAFFAGLSLKKFFGPEILYIGKVAATPSDRDNDGDVDGADLQIIQRDSAADPAVLAQWQSDFGRQDTTAWGIDPQDGTGQRVVEGSDASVDSFLVAKLTIGPDANDDTIELFVNPDITAGTPTGGLVVPFNEDPDTSVPDDQKRSIDEIRLGSQNGAFYADEIRIGATFADVTPSLIVSAITAVPEPSTAVLSIALGLIAVARRNRRVNLV